jgi:hypothetical protein
MHERRNIRLSGADRGKLEAVVANRNSPQKHVWRAKIVLLTANGCGTAEIMQATGKAKTVIWRWQERSRRIYCLLIDQHRVDDAAHLDKLLPITAVPGKAGYFPRRDTTHFAETNLGYHALKAGSRDATRR